jgi:hypothetical protein
MSRTTSLARLRVPLGGQEIELQEIEFDPAQAANEPGAAPALPLLRTRIREGKRFTIFDIDPASARAWGQALLDWAAAKEGR